MSDPASASAESAVPRCSRCGRGFAEAPPAGMCPEWGKIMAPKCGHRAHWLRDLPAGGHCAGVGGGVGGGGGAAWIGVPLWWGRALGYRYRATPWVRGVGILGLGVVLLFALVGGVMGSGLAGFYCGIVLCGVFLGPILVGTLLGYIMRATMK